MKLSGFEQAFRRALRPSEGRTTLMALATAGPSSVEIPREFVISARTLLSRSEAQQDSGDYRAMKPWI